MNKEKLDLYLRINTERSRLEGMVKQLKSAEDQVKAEILMALDAAGLDSAKEGGYTVSKKRVQRVEIADHAKLQSLMFALMGKAQAEGRPLQDGLLLQRTASKTAVQDYLKNLLGVDTLDPGDPRVQAAAEQMGIRLAEVVNLSVVKSK